MALPETERARVEKKVGQFCESRVPEHARDQVRLSYKIRGNAVIIYEQRAPFRLLDGAEWTSMEIAQLGYDEKSKKWTPFCYTRRGRADYLDLGPTVNIDKLLKEIDEDPTGIFWG